jgi:ATP-dependent Clp protease ATP-binding subunit ClpA
MNIIFKDLNESMSKVIASSARELTPAGIYKNILKDKNPVSEYFKNKINLEAILVDLEVENQKQKEDKKFTKAVKNFADSLPDMSRDRYVDELRFFVFSFNQKGFDKTILEILGKYLETDYIYEDLKAMIPAKPIQDWEANTKTVLDAFGRNLTKLAKEGELHRIVDRDEEIMKLIQILTRQTKSNPVLVGEAGVGKTAIVEKLAFILNEKSGIPSSLHDYQLYELSLPAIISSGDEEEIIELIINTSKQEKAILFIDEVHVIQNHQQGKIANLFKPAMARGDIKLIGATTEDEYKVFEDDKAMTRRFQPVKISEPDKVSLYRILKAKADETEEFHNVIIPDETLLKAISLSERYLTSKQQPDKAIDLLETSSAKLRMILESKPDVLINLQNKVSDIQIEIEMLKIREDKNERINKKIKDLTKDFKEYKKELKKKEAEYQKQKALFDGMLEAKNALKELHRFREVELQLGNFESAALVETKDIPEAQIKLENIEQRLLDFAQSSDEKLIQNVVIPDMISRIIEDMTGIPVKAQDQDDLEKYGNIEITLKEKVHGQDRPIDLISAAIKRSKAGLSDSNKPLGSFLCLGPTGVGKTYLAEKLAEFIFDTNKVLHRFDMSEYKEPHSVARLFGSPPGYVGHEKGGQLTELVKRNPYSMILFDEIEKAHSGVFDTLLQILDAGRMTDGQGQTVDFKNTIIIMTSNYGSEIIKKGVEKGYEAETIEIALLEELKKYFRPEFLNRFDAKVMFNSLRPEAIVQIADSELGKLAERLIHENNLDLNWHPDVPVYITNEAYSITDGARPIKRYLNDTVIDVLTNKILNGEIHKGDTIYMVIDNNNLEVFTVDIQGLKELKEKEQLSIVLESSKVLENNHSTIPDFNKVDESEIVTADIGSPKKKKKKKSKKSKKSWDSSFNLDTETGD